MNIYKSGTTIQFTGTLITGIITAATIRGELVQYEIGYWSEREYKVGWFIEEEFGVITNGNETAIGFTGGVKEKTTFSQIEISQRLYNALEFFLNREKECPSGIHNCDISILQKYSRRYYLKSSGFGRTSLAELDTIMNTHNLKYHP